MNRPAAGFATRRPEEPCVNSTSTVLWEPGRATAPATRQALAERCAPRRRGGRRAGLAPELVDEAVDRARLRAAVGLPDGGRLSDEVIDELLAGASTEEEIVGPGGLLAQLTKRLVERAMEVELTDHLGYEPHQEPPGGTGNTRNGSTPKTLITEHGPVPIDTPRDRDGGFEPKIVKKRQRRFQGFDEKILALYSRGLSTRDIEAHLEEIYGVKVGRELISKVTDAVMDDVRASSNSPSPTSRSATARSSPTPARARSAARHPGPVAGRPPSSGAGHGGHGDALRRSTPVKWKPHQGRYVERLVARQGRQPRASGLGWWTRYVERCRPRR